MPAVLLVVVDSILRFTGGGDNVREHGGNGLLLMVVGAIMMPWRFRREPRRALTGSHGDGKNKIMEKSLVTVFVLEVHAFHYIGITGLCGPPGYKKRRLLSVVPTRYRSCDMGFSP